MNSNPDALSGAWNFRDVAEETGIRPGRLFRSSELSRLDDSGRVALGSLGVTQVMDLRSEGEVERRGLGQVPDGVMIHRLSFHESSASGAVAPHEHGLRRLMAPVFDGDAVAFGRRYMSDVYRRFPTYPGAQHAVRQTVSALADGRPTIVHCAAGKDRTGFVIAVMLEALGVERGAILADYLRSNDSVSELREQVVAMLFGEDDRQSAPALMALAEVRLTEDVCGVREEYLHTAREAVDAHYGSLPNYLHAVGVTDELLARLHDALRSEDSE